jgi:Ca2+-binding EF-hand superfamily protein
MTSINSIGGGMQAMGGYGMGGGMRGMKRPDASEVASQVFSKLDTKNQGYLEKSDFVSALQSLDQSGSSKASSSASADDLFSALDSDGDGKITKSELTDTLKQVEQQLDQQLQQMRVQGGMQAGGMRPPPPPQDDQGLTKDELTTRASEVSSSDSKQADFLNSVAASFEKADANQDGKVTFKEAMDFKKSQETSSSQTDTSSASQSSNSPLSDAISQRILQLISAYGLGGQEQQGNSAASMLASA